MTASVATDPARLLHQARAYGLCGRLLTRQGGSRPRQVAGLLARELSSLGCPQAQGALQAFVASLPRRARRYVSWLATNAVPAYEASYHVGAQAAGGLELTLADVAGFYRAFGFQTRGERPDYLGAQLEFLALLTLKEAHAVLSGSQEGAGLCRRTRAEFARRHVLPWLPALRERAAAARIPAFTALADLVQALVLADLGTEQ
ncbi:MAG TPA: molecular chaperone TorD family protein [Dehalococcoidia bacterium]|nr:molecular chaperone TorD family protein [Dehalococcoidia bacterium]